MHHHCRIQSQQHAQHKEEEATHQTRRMQVEGHSNHSNTPIHLHQTPRPPDISNSKHGYNKVQTQTHPKTMTQDDSLGTTKIQTSSCCLSFIYVWKPYSMWLVIPQALVDYVFS